MLSTKENVLKILEENRGAALSGAAISRDLSVSRAAVWKAIEELRKEGHMILAATNKGYTLSDASDLLSAEGIMLHMETPAVTREHLHVFKSIDSTNLMAKKMALAGAAHGTVVLAEEQTQGRGRLGRSFYSPKGCGLYMSILLRPNRTKDTAILTTTAAAAAVCRALAGTFGIEAEIKWVNDIYVGGRKICGILTEGVTDFETGSIEALVVGIGINVFEGEAGFPHEIREIAGTLKDSIQDKEISGSRLCSLDRNRLDRNRLDRNRLDRNRLDRNRLDRNRLAAAVISEVIKINENLRPEDFLPEYKARSLVLGKDITVYRGSDQYEAKAVDIDEQGGLVVQKKDGAVETLNSGEITIRPVAFSKSQDMSKSGT